MRIAVIGSGISGLSVSHFLSKKYKVDLFEKHDHFGGHSYTAEVPLENSKDKIPIDLGFIVFNKVNYPNLVKLFSHLQIPYEKSDMSFSVSVKNSNIEYSGSGLKGLFSNKYNIFNYSFLKMLNEIIFFYREAEKLNENEYENKTLEDFLKSKRMSNYFTNFHIIPMVAAIWSMPSNLAKKMPLTLFLNFFKNHGLFKIKNRPQWYTVTGRSKIYVNKIDEHNYEGTAGDVVGKAKGYSYGPTFKFEYVLLVPVKGKKMKITFDDWIFKQNDRIAINRATMTKFGIRVAELTVLFAKD